MEIPCTDDQISSPNQFISPKAMEKPILHWMNRPSSKEPKNNIDSFFDNLNINTGFIMVPIIIFRGEPKWSTVTACDDQSDDLVGLLGWYAVSWIILLRSEMSRIKGLGIYMDTCVTVVMAFVLLLVINLEYYVLAPFPISLIIFITYLWNEISGSNDALSMKKIGLRRYTSIKKSGSRDASSKNKSRSKDKDSKKFDKLVGPPINPSGSNDKRMDKIESNKIGELERTVVMPNFMLLISAIYSDGSPVLSHFLLFSCCALGTLALMYSRLSDGVNPLKQAHECVQMAYMVMLFITVHTVAAEWLGEAMCLVCIPELIAGFLWVSTFLHGGSTNRAVVKVETDNNGHLFIPVGAILAWLTITYGYEGEFLASWYTKATVSCAVAGCMQYINLWMISRWPGSISGSQKATQLVMFPANICLTGASLMLFAWLAEKTLGYRLFGLDDHIDPGVLKYYLPRSYFAAAVAWLVALFVKRFLLHVDYRMELPSGRAAE